MPNFSKNPQQLLDANRDKSYVGARLIQGGLVLDRDLNLLGDLPAAALREVFEKHIGRGAADAEAFKVFPVNPPGNDFWLSEGTLLVGGHLVSTPWTKYSSLGLPALEVYAGQGNRTDRVYLDVWLAEVDRLTDPELFNPDDFEMQTSVRLKPRWTLKVVKGGDELTITEGHIYYEIAELVREMNVEALTEDAIHDRRATNLHLPSAVSRVSVCEANALTLGEALQPRLAADPWSHGKAYPGLCLTLRGRHLNLGAVKVELRADTAQTGVWTEAPLVGDPEPNELRVSIPQGVTGPAKVAVRTGCGRVEAPGTLYIYGPPQFARMGPQLTPNQTECGCVVTLFGQFFDIQGATVEVLAYGSPSDWIPATIVAGSATPEQLKIKAPRSAGVYQVRVRTLASTQPALSNEQLTVEGGF